MKTIRIIDLLNKIANGEEVPKEIKIKTSKGTIAPFYLSDDEYINNYTGYSLLECLDEFQLTDKILYEEDEFEDIEEITIRDTTIGFPNGEWTARNMDKAFAIKINQLIKNQNKIIERLQHENSKDNV